jgi:hypothetical protein
MTETNRPVEGKIVTLVVVFKGEPIVTYGKVLLSKNNLVALHLPARSDDELARLADAPATLLYGLGDLSYVLRGRISEVVGSDRVVLSTPHAPHIGERREFIRADMELLVRVALPPSSVASPEALAEWVEVQSLDPSVYNLVSTRVDLSGSGARLSYPCTGGKGDPACVTFLVDWKGGRQVVHLLSKVVRCKRTADGQTELAVEFSRVSEEQREMLSFVVFQARAKNLGIRGMQFLEEP